MSVIVPLVLALLLLCLQTFTSVAFGLDAWTPNFVLVLVVYLGTARNWTVGAMLCAAVGLLADGFTSSPVGVHMLHSILTFYGIAWLSVRVRFTGLLGRALLGLISGIFSLALFAAIGRIFLGDTQLAARIGALFLPRVVLMILLIPLLMPLLERVDGFFARFDGERL